MRIKRSVNALKKRRKIMRLSKGYFGNKSKSYRIARQAVMKSLNYAYIGRRLRKRDMRSLWIARINAAARINGLSYSKLMHGLKTAGINLNRKVLADLAVNDEKAFAELAAKAKQAL
ncbi:MAG: 50S ribosomal protein L20 [Clostridia bacterium]|nr:50S ribosomal protein L20 [Clostridia bacterium]